MTKRDYVILSRVLRETAQCFSDPTPAQTTMLAFIKGKLLKELTADNRNFDPERFIEACEP